METFCEMIKYVKATDLIPADIELLCKLEQDFFPVDAVCNMINKKHATLIRVYYDEKIYGILVVRGVNLMDNELCMVIDHAIAEDNIDIHFENILRESLWQFVANENFNGKYFTQIHQSAHNRGLKKILERHYGEAKEFIFKKDVREFKNDKSVPIVVKRMSTV